MGQSHVLDKGWTNTNALERSNQRSRDLMDFKHTANNESSNVLQLLQAAS